MALIKTELASVGLNSGYSHQSTDNQLPTPSSPKQLKLSTLPDHHPPNNSPSAPLSPNPSQKTTPFLAPQLAHTVCCTPQSRLRATLLHVAREASLSLTSGDSLAADALIRWLVRCGLLPVGRVDECGWVVRWAGFKDGGWGLARRISGRGGSGGRMGNGVYDHQLEALRSGRSGATVRMEWKM